MITAIRLKNFKCFEDSGWIDIKSLNLLFGYNSSGKSSILKFFLMIKQTLESSVNDRASLIFSDKNGVDLGSYKDVVFGGDIKKDIEFSFKFILSDLLGDDIFKSMSFISYMINHSDNLVLNLTFGYDENKKVVFQKKYEIVHGDTTIILLQNKNNSKLEFSLLDRANVDFNKDDLTKNDFELITYNFLIITKVKALDPNLSKSPLSNNVTLLTFILSSVLERYFSTLIHIGPIRKSPNRVDRFTSDNPQNVGSTGEFAYNLLYNSAKEDISNQDKLLIKVNKWLKFYNYELILNEIAQDIVEFQLIDIRSKNTISIVDAGFGISQVLPIVVELMNSNKGEKIILVEQPEIHLHTKMQAELADLLIECTKLNSSNIIFVETHSENLLLRLRKSLLENQINSSNGFDKNDLSTLYISNDGVKSSISKITFTDNGSVTCENKEFDDFFGSSFDEFMEISKLSNQLRSVKQ